MFCTSGATHDEASHQFRLGFCDDGHKAKSAHCTSDAASHRVGSAVLIQSVLLDGVVCSYQRCPGEASHYDKAVDLDFIGLVTCLMSKCRA